MAKKVINNREVALENLKTAKSALEKDYAENPHQSLYTIIISLELEIRNLIRILEK